MKEVELNGVKLYYNSKLIILNMKQRQKLFGFVNV